MTKSTLVTAEDGVEQQTSFISIGKLVHTENASSLHSDSVEVGEEGSGNVDSEREAKDDGEGRGNNKECKFFSWTQHIPARVVLGIVSFIGFGTNYMIRVNINIAIVAMVNTKHIAPVLPDSSALNEESACFSKTIYEHNGTDNNATFEIGKSTVLQDNKQEEELFSWNSIEQGLILGSFYWGYVASSVPGAILSRLFGAKLVFGSSNGITALLTLIIPFAARIGLPFLIIIRVLQGFASGTNGPAMNTLASHWIPPHERSKFITTYLGNSVGIAATYPICGLLIEYYGWASAFYVPGCITLVWCVFWWLLAFETPNVHPRITPEERAYIENAVSPTLNKNQLAVPWMEILKSGPFWALVCANLGSLWGYMTILTYAPTYLKNILGFNIQTNGALSGLPNVMRFIFGVISSYITDHLIKAKIFSFTIIRKAATLTTVVLPGLLYLLMTNVGCNAAAEVAILTTAAALGGVTSSGPLANTMDLAPNFSGILMSLVCLVGMSAGYLVPFVVGAIISNNDSREGWRMIFIISALVSILSGIIFTFFGSGEVQPWNENDVKNKLEKEYTEVLQQEVQDSCNETTTNYEINMKNTSTRKTEEEI